MQWCFNYRNTIAIVKMGAIVTPIIEYVLPKPNEKFCVNSSTHENDTSEKGDFELTNTEEAVHHVEAP